MARNKRTNPFYVLLLLAGVAFSISACAYGVMTFRGSHGSATSRAAAEQHPLWTLFDRYGAWILGGELALLGVCTVGVIATDRPTEKRIGPQASRVDSSARPPSPSSSSTESPQ